MTDTTCPADRLLARHALGRLPDADAEAVERHLLGCSRCVARVRAAGVESPLVGLLRSRPAVTVPQGPEVEAVVTRVREAAAASGQETPTLGEPNTPAWDEPDDSDDDGLAPAQGPDELGRLGPYRVLGVLGRGGMGVVFRAVDPRLEREVAIKVMRGSRGASADRRERFLREARLAAGLQHDNVVPVYHVGEESGVLFLVMPVLAGETLAGRIARDGGLPAAEVIRVGREAADGLAAAHAKGLTHRDVKPANLWLEGESGRVRVLDFGLARPAGAADGLTRDGQLLGTPAYMPPEQTRGTADARSDVYSLGATLFEAATGRRPFDGPDVMALLTAVHLDAPPDAADLVPGLPAELSDLIARCLAKHPGDRPQSARELADELRAVGQGPAAVRPRPARRWRAAVAGGLVAALAVLLGVVVHRVQTDRGELVITTDDPDVEVTVKRNGGVVEVVDVRSKQTVTLKSGAYTLELSRGADGLTLETTDFTLTRNGVATARVTFVPKAAQPAPAAGPSPGRLELRGHDGEVTAVAVAPDGRFAASAGWDGTVRVWDLHAGTEVAKAAGDGKPLTAVAVSPDGRWVAAGGVGPGVLRWKVGPDLALAPQPPASGSDKLAGIGAVVLTANGRLFAAAEDGTVRGWQAANGRPIFTAPPDPGRAGVAALAPSPGGAWLLVGRTDGDGGFVRVVWLGPAGGGKSFVGHTGAVHAVAFARGGRLAVTGSLDTTARVWDADAGTEMPYRLAHPAGVRAVAAADGRVATGCDDGRVRLWDAATGREVSLAGRGEHRGKVLSVALTADGLRAVSGGEDGAVRVWNLPAAE